MFEEHRKKMEGTKCVDYSSSDYEKDAFNVTECLTISYFGLT
jgi:hypothetical protein